MKAIKITLSLTIWMVFLGCTKENLQPQLAAATSSAHAPANSSREPEEWIIKFRDAIEDNNLRIAKGILVQCSKRQLQTILNNPFWSIALNRTAYPLHVAADRGYCQLVSLLLDKGADPEVETRSSKFTPLHLAVRSKRADAVKLLLTKEAKNVSYLDYEARTKPMPIKTIASVSTNVNAQDIDGLTPLHWAGKEGFEKIAALLLSNHADQGIRDNEGRTALELAQACHKPHIVKLLENPAGQHEPAPGCCYRVCSKIKKVKLGVHILHLCGVEAELQRRD